MVEELMCNGRSDEKKIYNENQSLISVRFIKWVKDSFMIYIVTQQTHWIEIKYDGCSHFANSYILNILFETIKCVKFYTEKIQKDTAKGVLLGVSISQFNIHEMKCWVRRVQFSVQFVLRTFFSFFFLFSSHSFFILLLLLHCIAAYFQRCFVSLHILLISLYLRQRTANIYFIVLRARFESGRHSRILHVSTLLLRRIQLSNIVFMRTMSQR